MASKKPKGPPVKVLECGLDKDDDKFVYFVDRRGNLLRMERGVARAKSEVVIEKAVEKREKGYMYYLDDDGDLVKEPD
jgi:hypothetical protein